MATRRVITVDGNAGSGKTTLARALAKRIGYIHFSSGLLYRGAAFLCLSEGVLPTDFHAVIALIRDHVIEIRAGSEQESRLYVDGGDVTDKVAAPEVSEATSLLSTYQEVREALTGAQRTAFQNQNIVAEGRDMGTVIFPGADLKFFVSADEGVRVRRRIEQFLRMNPGLDEATLNQLKEKMKIEIIERDLRDSSRLYAPTRAAPDALLIDNSARSLTEVVDYMYDVVSKKGLLEKRVI